MDRAEIPESQRKDFFLHIDEFHNFTTESFATILAEARKYRLCLSLAHQYLDQMTEATRHAVFGNVGTLLCFRVGNRDAQILGREFYPTFREDDLIALGKYQLYLKLAIGGATSEAFSAAALPPFQNYSVGRGENIRAQSRRRFARRRAFIEGRIRDWFEASGCASR